MPVRPARLRHLAWGCALLLAACSPGRPDLYDGSGGDEPGAPRFEVSNGTLRSGGRIRAEVVVRSGEALAVRLESDDFDAHLRIVGPDGTEFENDDHDGTHSLAYVRDAAPGTWTVEGRSYDDSSTGAYSLSTLAGRPIAIRAELNSRDPATDDHGFADAYTIAARRGDLVVAEMATPGGFDGYLATTRDGERLTFDDWDSSRERSVAAVRAEGSSVPLVATSLSAGETGGYTLYVLAPSGRAVAAPPAQVAVVMGAGQDLDLNLDYADSALAVGSLTEGYLDAADFVLADGSYYDLYTFQGEPNQAIEITMASSDFDAFLGGGATELIAVSGSGDADDDSGGGTDARLRVQAGPDGQYVIRANSLRPGVTGTYTIEVLDPGGEDEIYDQVTVARMGQTLSGRLDASDQTLDDGSTYDLFTFAGTSGQEIVVTLSSDDFDPYLVLHRVFGGELELVAQDDDSGPGTNARIRATLPQSGTYVIVANAFAAGATGSYRLAVDRPEAVTDDEGTASSMPAILAGQPVSGRLTEDDARLADDSFADLYVYRGTPGEEVTATLRSSDFDAFVSVATLDGGDLTFLAGDDDSGGGTDAQVRFTIGGTGVYAVQANSYAAGATGAYTLVVERAMAPDPDAAEASGRARFVGKWSPATYLDTDGYPEVREQVESSRRLESVAEVLNVQFPLPTNVPISFEECGYVNAYYDPSTGSVTFCYELMQMMEATLAAQVEPERVREAVDGAYSFIMLHEVGHALTDQLDLPITGREEDVADQFATLTLVREGDKGAQSAIYGVLALQQEGSTFGDSDFADEHSLNPVRLYNVACWVFGSDPDKYGWMVENGALPVDRAVRCPGEYVQMEKSWSRLFGLVYGD